jgi:hypothetical protein
MLMVAALSFSALLFTAFWLKPKRLHLFELLAIWFMVTAVNSPIYTYFLENRHWITVPNNKQLALVRITFTEFLNPLIITWVLDEVLILKSFVLRLMCYIGTLGVLFLGGFTLHILGIAPFKSMGLIWYAPFKSITILMSLFSVWLIRHLMRKDGI